MADKRPKQELYLKIPYHILNLDGIGLCEKMLLAHIYSFGAKGCWQSNETMGKVFSVTGRTISTWVANLKKAGCIFWVHPKGRYRTIWARAHPQVKTAETLLYMGKEISKDAVISGHAAQILLRRNLPDPHEETFLSTTKNDRIQVGRNLPHTKNTTIISTTRKTIATPSPLPAGGQAPASLEERKCQQQVQLEQFKLSFGKSAGRETPLTVEEFERRKAAALKTLRNSSFVASGQA